MKCVKIINALPRRLTTVAYTYSTNCTPYGPRISYRTHWRAESAGNRSFAMFSSIFMMRRKWITHSSYSNAFWAHFSHEHCMTINVRRKNQKKKNKKSPAINLMQRTTINAGTYSSWTRICVQTSDSFHFRFRLFILLFRRYMNKGKKKKREKNYIYHEREWLRMRASQLT